jgi:aminoglycoside phosphotransferase (APT) family kinase protein
MTSRKREHASDISQRRVMADLLRTFRRELAETVRPEVRSPYPIYVVDLMGMVLEYMEDWAAGDGYPDIDAGRKQLLDALTTVRDGRSHYLADFDDGARCDEALAAAVHAAAATGDDAVLARLGPQIAALNEKLYIDENTRLAATRGTERAILDEIYPSMSIERVQRYLSTKLAIVDDPVRRVTEIPGGHSKDTYIIALDSRRELVVRRDFPFGPVATSAPDEFELLRRLANDGMPVARPLAAEYDRQHLGLPFLVVEKVRGSDPTLPDAAWPATGRDVSLELARILARLHRYDPVELGFPRSADSPQQQVRAYLAQWRAWWEKNRVHASSLLEAGFAWLERHVPSDIERIVTVHGDARPGNMLAFEGRTTALLDWEFAHPGDPAEDLLYAKGFVEPYVSAEEFMATYRDAGGAPLSDSGMRYYEIFRSLRNVVCCEVAWGGFVLGKYPAFKLISQGVVFRRTIALELAKSMRQLEW